ncbi:Innexin-19 [Toxocara canis]|uniref:Innexin n=1 Tax=Toxocara canis TaxID=6265 RepID=A0A0B2VDJ7_TOXCA|nr:Innexin-19 [Toxocara canis]
MFFHATLARSFIQSLHLRGDDDFVDRLNYYYTPVMLAVACLIISAKQYGGTPIECWVNPHSRESMEEYIESYCWIQNTYWVPMYENIPDDHTARESNERQIGYYQWVPFILIAEALMFSLPCMTWRLLNWQSGLNIQRIISTACDIQAIADSSAKRDAIETLGSSIIGFVDLQSPSDTLPHRSFFSAFKCYSLVAGHYATSLYLLTKLCYTANIVLQFILLNAALKSDEYLLFGFQVLSDLLCGKPWTESGHFPRVTLCDFEVRYLANLNSCSTLFWMSSSIFLSEKVDYVLRFMRIAESAERNKECKMRNPPARGLFAVVTLAPHLVDKFVADFLKSDGVFTLRLMANHAGELVVVDVVRCLWNEFRERNWREFEELEQSNRAREVKGNLVRYLPHTDSRTHLKSGGLPPPMIIKQKVLTETSGKDANN